ncbi:MAG: hypothetical protein IPK32_09680 [Verrucomicrobiaceae bacterium]|nr:hypothetical protein [Verrucomicrobiaceae bacterium]
MISPDDIRKKAINLYPAYVKAWLVGESFFPCVIRGSKTLNVDDPSGSIASIQLLRDQSKAVTGKGYSVEWVERASRSHGRNAFPQRVIVESEADFLWLNGKREDFARFSKAVLTLRAEFPELTRWIASHTAKLTELADSAEGLVSVMKYFKAHPKPGMFARELPLPVPTKFMEWNQTVLREMLDLVLDPTSIDASEMQFERRYGLRCVQPHLFIRLLDHRLMSELGLPFDELSLPIDTLATLPASDLRVFIVENKVNALTLPMMSRSIVLGGLGDGVVLFRRLPWLPDCDVIYWGDLDAEGFEALSSIRSHAPEAKTMFMDVQTLKVWSILGSEGTGKRSPKPLHLSPDEADAYRECCESNLRIEQERLPQAAVIEALAARGWGTSFVIA